MCRWLHVAQMDVLEKSILTSSGGTACALLLFFILRNVVPGFHSPPSSQWPASQVCLQVEVDRVKAGENPLLKVWLVQEMAQLRVQSDMRCIRGRGWFHHLRSDKHLSMKYNIQHSIIYKSFAVFVKFNIKQRVCFIYSKIAPYKCIL